MASQHYWNREFIITQGVLKSKNYLGPSREKYTLDFLFYISLLEGGFKILVRRLVGYPSFITKDVIVVRPVNFVKSPITEYS